LSQSCSGGTSSIFKGTVARDFRHSFFSHQSTPPWTLIHGLKPFRAYGFVFAEIIASKVVKLGFSGVNDPDETEYEVLNSQFFCLKLRYGIGIFLYEIVLRDIPLQKMLWAQNDDLKFKRGHINYSWVNDPAEIRILSIFSANIRSYAKRL
jgi:hypothetical protein